MIHLVAKLAPAETPHEDQQPEDGKDSTPDATSRKIAVVDGMVLLQKMAAKPETTVTVKHLSECFNDRLMFLTRDYDETILVIDTYRDDSLKNATRDKRRQGRAPIQYQVRDDTNIKHIRMSKFFHMTRQRLT